MKSFKQIVDKERKQSFDEWFTPRVEREIRGLAIMQGCPVLTTKQIRDAAKSCWDKRDDII